MILDGGASEVGIESTVLDLTVTPPRLLRPGEISGEMVAEVLGGDVATETPSQQIHSPGTSWRHYRPVTPAKVMRRPEIRQAVHNVTGDVVCLILEPGEDELSAGAPMGRVHVMRLPAEGRAYAAALYEALREADGRRAALLLIEWPEQPGAIWEAIRNRLSRAAGPGDGPGDSPGDSKLRP